MLIYQITNVINGKRYIGQTSRNLKRRWAEHKSWAFRSNKYRSKAPLHRAIRKYGSEAFTIEQIAECSNADSMDYAEQYFIRLYNTLSRSGYNANAGGDGNRGHNPSVATRNAIANTLANKPKQTHCKNGHLLTENNLYVYKEKHRECKICRDARGKHHNDLAKTKCLRRGSPEHRQLMREKSTENKHALGFKHSEESRKKISENNKGKPWSEKERIGHYIPPHPSPICHPTRTGTRYNLCQSCLVMIRRGQPGGIYRSLVASGKIRSVILRNDTCENQTLIKDIETKMER